MIITVSCPGLLIPPQRMLKDWLQRTRGGLIPPSLFLGINRSVFSVTLASLYLLTWTCCDTAIAFTPKLILEYLWVPFKVTEGHVNLIRFSYKNSQVNAGNALHIYESLGVSKGSWSWLNPIEINGTQWRLICPIDFNGIWFWLTLFGYDPFAFLLKAREHLQFVQRLLPGSGPKVILKWKATEWAFLNSCSE